MPLDTKAVTADDEDDDREQVADHEYATREEAEQAIFALTEADYVKLMVLAFMHWKQRKLCDLMHPQELLSEAILRTIAPSKRPRRWRKAVVSLIDHLNRTMESISGHAVGQAVAETAVLSDLHAQEVDPRTAAPRRFHRAVAEERLLARAELDDIEQAFAGAPRAFDLLRMKAEGYSESEIMTRLGISKREYETARKKAEREIAKYALRSEREMKP